MYHVRSSETRRATPMASDRNHFDSIVPQPPREPVRQAPPPDHDARILTGGGNEAEIRLDGVRYVLRITRQGKLILTK